MCVSVPAAHTGWRFCSRRKSGPLSSPSGAKNSNCHHQSQKTLGHHCRCQRPLHLSVPSLPGAGSLQGEQIVSFPSRLLAAASSSSHSHWSFCAFFFPPVPPPPTRWGLFLQPLSLPFTHDNYTVFIRDLGCLAWPVAIATWLLPSSF